MVKDLTPVCPGACGARTDVGGCAAVAYLATMKCRDSDHPVGVVVWFHLLAFPIMGALSLPQWTPMTTPMWGLAALVGLLSIAAQILMTVALHQEDAGMVMPFKYLGAVMALSAGWILYGETMSSMSLLGMGLVVVCIATNTWSNRSRVRRLPDSQSHAEAEPKRRHSGDQRQDRPRGRVGNPPHVEGHPQSHQGSKC